MKFPSYSFVDGYRLRHQVHRQCHNVRHSSTDDADVAVRYPSGRQKTLVFVQQEQSITRMDGLSDDDPLVAPARLAYICRNGPPRGPCLESQTSFQIASRSSNEQHPPKHGDAKRCNQRATDTNGVGGHVEQEICRFSGAHLLLFSLWCRARGITLGRLGHGRRDWTSISCDARGDTARFCGTMFYLVWSRLIFAAREGLAAACSNLLLGFSAY